MEIAFKILNASVLPFWIMLAFFVKSKATNKLLFSYIAPLLLAVVYMGLIGVGLFENLDAEGGMSSLATLRISFLNDAVLLGAWVHYLVFDLFVGIWIAKKCLEENIPIWIKLPSLFFTLIFGPFGFLLFMSAQYCIKKRRNI